MLFIFKILECIMKFYIVGNMFFIVLMNKKIEIICKGGKYM